MAAQVSANSQSAMLLGAFCQQFQDLLEDLIRICPEHTDFKVFLTGFGLVRQNSPEFIMAQFIKNVYPYKDKIMARDESYFLDDKTAIENQVKEKSGQEDLVGKVLNLKEIWKTRLSVENKEIVWKYLHVLIVLSERWFQAQGA